MNQGASSCLPTGCPPASLLAFPAWNFSCKAHLELTSESSPPPATILATSGCAFAPAPPALACPAPFSPSPASKADCRPANEALKVSQAVGLRGDPSPFPSPAPSRAAPLRPYSPAEVRLSRPAEVLLALGPVVSSKASRSILRCLWPAGPSPTQAAAASSARSPVLEREPAVPKGVFRAACSLSCL